MLLACQRTVLACLAAVALAGAAPQAFAQGAAGGASALPSPQAAAADISAYRVGPEDLLEITVWREEALKRDVLVRPDGGISYPVIGEVVAGTCNLTRVGI